jgi:hypothetical protein
MPCNSVKIPALGQFRSRKRQTRIASSAIFYMFRGNNRAFDLIKTSLTRYPL